MPSAAKMKLTKLTRHHPLELHHQDEVTALRVIPSQNSHALAKPCRYSKRKDLAVRCSKHVVRRAAKKTHQLLRNHSAKTTCHTWLRT
mmetsp:Transcript_27548/g.45112  ORF Transcript_27548/g.45112 Transcript_27548/m.45112 type:complete len:88 (-) Transcript_27548:7-270(-)